MEQTIEISGKNISLYSENGSVYVRIRENKAGRKEAAKGLSDQSRKGDKNEH